MTKSLLAWANSNAHVFNTTAEFLVLADAGVDSINATEAQAQYVVRTAGKVSGLAINVIGGTYTGASLTSRKNGAAGALAPTITNSTNGLYIDAVNADSLAVGDKWNVRSVVSTNTLTTTYIRANFEALSGHAALHGFANGAGETVTGNASVQYLRPAGVNPIVGTTETNAKLKIRAAGTAGNFQVYVKTANAGTTVTYKSRKNAVDGGCSIAVSSGLTGLFEDSAHTDTLAAGDDYNFSITHGAASGTQVITFLGYVFTGTAGTNDVFSARGQNYTTPTATDFQPIIGDLSFENATEANGSITHGFPVLTSRMRLFVSTNTHSATSTIVLRNGGVDGAQTFSIGAGVTGLFEDTTHTDLCLPGSAVCWKKTGSGTGLVALEWFGLTEQDVSYTPFARDKADLSYLRM